MVLKIWHAYELPGIFDYNADFYSVCYKPIKHMCGIACIFTKRVPSDSAPESLKTTIKGQKKMFIRDLELCGLDFEITIKR